jgi:hypothetical protein
MHVEKGKLILAFDAKGPEDYGVDERKDSGVRAYAKRECQNRSDGESGTATQTADRDDQVLE